MIVSEQAARRIVGERKTQHRLPRSFVAPARQIMPVKVRRTNPHLGYVDGEPKTELVTVCMVRVMAVDAGFLSQVDEQAAKAEGFKSVDEFLADWEARHDFVKPDRPVWVVYFELDRTCKPRYLSERVIAGQQGDYVTNPHRALPDEAEAIDEYTLERFVKENKLKDDKRRKLRAVDVAALPVDQQISVLTVEARSRYIDVRDELRAIRRYRGKDEVIEPKLRALRSRLGLH